MVNADAQASFERKKAIALFSYLKELSQLRSRMIRSVDQYEEVLWLQNIPKRPGCSCAAWEANDEPDTWIQIAKPRFREPPKPVTALAPWLDDRQLHDSSCTMPDLLQAPSVQATVIPTQDIKALHDNYVQDQWWPWAEEDKELRRVQEVYASLFSMYQKQQRLGEAYEIIVGLGLLTWMTPSGQPVKRHILAAQATVEFDVITGVISVTPPAEGARVRLEQDMLEPQDRPQQGTDDIQQLIAEMGDSLWDGTSAQKILQTWINSAPSNGRFVNSLAPQASARNYPVVDFAPALILRKRSEGNFAAVFEKIVKQLEEGKERIPNSVLEMVSDGYVASDDISTDPAENSDCEIYFPLPSNHEQLKIATSLRGENGVVVQGPPGTGKSHTIANLVCHLLAQGKRVLVTSHTPRALTVLRDKFPEEIKGLCVSLLGNGRLALKDMEDSVAAISSHYANWDLRRNNERISRLSNRLSELRTQESKAMLNLRQLREAETYVHELPVGNYQGTAQAIAKRLKEGTSEYSWINVQPRLNVPPPLSDAEAMLLLRLLREITPQREMELGYRLIDIVGMPTDEEFAQVTGKERDAKALHDQTYDQRQHPSYRSLVAAPVAERQAAISDLHHLLDGVLHLRSLSTPWVETALSEVLKGQKTPWETLFANTQRILDSLGDGYEVVDSYRVSGAGDVDRQVLKADAEGLQAHFSSGGKWGVGPFKPAPVKNAQYLVKQVRLNGQSCKNVEALQKLIRWASVLDRVEDLHGYWRPWLSLPAGNPSIQVGAYKEQQKLLGEMLTLATVAEQLRGHLRGMGITQEPVWNDPQNLASLLSALRAVDTEIALTEATSVLKGMEGQLYLVLSKPNAHSVVGNLLQAVKARDVQAYASCRVRLMDLLEVQKQLEERRNLLKRLTEGAPGLVMELITTFADTQWDSRMERFSASWDWAKADAWLSAWLKQAADPEGMEKRLDQLGKEILGTLGELAEAKAWGHCLSSMTETERRSLIAWQQAVKKIGKGTGKYAAQHRREAQTHMDSCRTAIPAWIMPLYRVAETVNPKPGLFDVAIIDEASQSGQEALLLNYIANQVVVVGDDKQISPENVGISPSDINALQQLYLKGIPRPDTYDLATSFFDQSRITYKSMLRLREHFRCMPEIIQFSNSHFYTSEPLIPLRQFGGSRLTPVVTTCYVDGGYRTGGNGPNPPEARAIVDKIKSMVADPRYNGKTMGVISLVATSDQDKEIEKLLLQEVGPEEIERRALVCGDPYAFQGDERDIMLLSLVAAPTATHMASVTGMRDEQRFNVAASRAKDQMWLFHSVNLSDISNKESLRYKLLDYCQNPRVGQTPLKEFESLIRAASRPSRRKREQPSPFDSWFEVDVYLRIVPRGYRVIPQFEIAGKRIDMVVEGMEGRLVVECDGDEIHGAEQYEADMARERMLERCGWKFWRVRGSEFGRNPDQAMSGLWEELERQGIKPQ